ncbi:hypothetical protein HELRODRAFT_192148 [Helobdella robusta]|uniref:Hydroxylamine reductase n=1 Tax=Helobdella robusta TaxID=6412 RepID=T1FTM7_HELRO|nr:hypothetical protein HELRODRAFT_192148 [Helobdella robusta]ESO02768.1 hypothetical protein HELRODRAFT_192148 [Helobdella robusta]
MATRIVRSINLASNLSRSFKLNRPALSAVINNIQWSGEPNILQTRSSIVTSASTKMDEDKMFCFQCEQTKLRKGCTTVGVCGKTAEVAEMQDLLCNLVKAVGLYGHNLKLAGGKVPFEIFDFTFSSLFRWSNTIFVFVKNTLTNVNFDPKRFVEYIKKACKYRNQLQLAYEAKCKEQNIPVKNFKHISEVSWSPNRNGEEQWTIEFLTEEGKKFGVLREMSDYGRDVHGVREMIVYGLKGMSTYARHARLLGEWDDSIGEDVFEILSFLIDGNKDQRHDLSTNLSWALKVGEINMRGMALLDKGHRKRFGVPSPAQVTTSPKPGKCILVTGHDMNDMEIILKEAEKRNVNVFTHGEMLPAHGYPNLRKYKSLAGHYGGAWQNQKYEFPGFPGPIVVTTNCIVEPMKSYKDRLFTLNETGWPGCKHIDLEKDLRKLMEAANNSAGFTEKDVVSNARTLKVGFGHEAILANAGKILESVENGNLKRVFVIGGCDGSENKRSYFSTLAKCTPGDSIILTMGCAKYRFNHMDLGELGDTGIPRLLDLGQCNDSYGAVVVAQALASALKTDVNSLPLSLAVSWFEQKAVAVFLTLLHLGIQNIRLGPVLPAFVTPTIQKILEDKFKLMSVDVKHPIDDLKEMMSG